MTRSREALKKRARQSSALLTALFILFSFVAALTVLTEARLTTSHASGRRPHAPTEYRSRPTDAARDFLKGEGKGANAPAVATAAAQATPTPTPAEKANTAETDDADDAANAKETTEGNAQEAKPLQYPLPELKPLGNAGRKTIEPVDPATEEFIPLPDRWRWGWPRYDRYERKRETPWVESSPLDPYNQNILKGDYPVFGNHTFLNLNFQSATNLNPRTVAAGGRRDQFFTNQNFVMGAELFKGTTVFEPKRWALRVTTVLNFNFLANNTLNPFDSRRGKTRLAVEEAFFEKRLAIISPDFDFVSVRAGMQNFTSDFRGFLFSENQLGIRFFGNANTNRDQYNFAYFAMRQRDEVSQLHIFDRRRQHVFIANWFRQDFLKKGYTAMVNFHFNHDRGISPGDRERSLDVAYFGFHGDGRLGNWNISHAFYQALGEDHFNRVAQRSVSINAQMAALELSRDRDWLRYRGSLFYASGDGDLNDRKGRGFDMISDNPNFAGGQFQFWTQQTSVVGGGIGLLTNKFSLLPNLRNKFTQRSNFVNPGILMANFGVDMRITPKLKAVTNLSYLRFAQTRVLQQLTADPGIKSGIGIDLSGGVKFRPFENENAFMVFGLSALFPHGGYGQLIGSTRPLISPVVALNFAF